MCDKLSPQGDSPDRWSRLTDKLEEAEQCNAQLRDVLEFTQLQVAQLTTERDGCRDLIATQRTMLANAEATAWELRSAANSENIRLHEQLTAAEQENARLREGIETTINYVRTGVHCRMIDHKMDSCDCEKISDEFAALLAQSEGGNDGT